MEESRELTNKQNDGEKNAELLLKKRIRMQILVLAASVLLVVVLIFAMSAAWFTNVAKTSDLVFQTESWGFDAEKIKLSDLTIPISPGTSGIVPMSVDNSGATESVQIGVTISKSEMEPELQKRIFFYADTAKTNTFKQEASEGEGEETTASETMSRVYLGASAPDNYTYTILPGQILTMNEIYYNDVPIKWEWVYDMVGYYFRGVVDESAADNPVAVDEYIRPIEYDYEQAVFDLGETDSEGNVNSNYHQLKFIGDKTVEEFMEDISSADGYEGMIDVEEAVAIEVETNTDDGTKRTMTHFYYPVEVDKHTGYGIWAYLCTLDEVEEGIVYDTEMANASEDVTAKATIIFTASSVAAKTTNVKTEAALTEALADSSVDIIKLDMDILATNFITLSEGEKIIDLNGYALQYDGLETEYDLISVTNGASLTVINGQMIENTPATALSTKFNKTAVNAAGGNVILSGVKIDGFDCAVEVEDMTESAGDSIVQIVDCELNTTQATVALQGNGSETAATSKMFIQNSKLNSEYYVAITGQGNSSAEDERWGTELVIADSEIYGYYGGLYQPQQKSVTTISSSKVSGTTAIAVKGGTVNIYDSEIIGTGEAEITDAKITGSGYTDTGDGIYIEAGYDWAATVIIKGDATTVTSEKAYAVEIIGTEGKGPGKVMIYDDGTYTGSKGSAYWNEMGIFEIYGGNYNGTVKDTITRYDKTTE